MLILIYIEVQYSQKAVFTFGKGSNRQKHSSSGSVHLVTPTVIYPIPHPIGGDFTPPDPHPPPLTAIWKTLHSSKRFKLLSVIVLLCLCNTSKKHDYKIITLSLILTFDEVIVGMRT